MTTKIWNIFFRNTKANKIIINNKGNFSLLNSSLEVINFNNTLSLTKLSIRIELDALYTKERVKVSKITIIDEKIKSNTNL